MRRIHPGGTPAGAGDYRDAGGHRRSSRAGPNKLVTAPTQIANFGVVLDAFEVDNGYYPKERTGFWTGAARDAINWRGLKNEIPNDPWGNHTSMNAPAQ